MMSSDTQQPHTVALNALAEDTLLTIRNLRVDFRTREGVVEALAGVDLDVHRGETLGLVGESGCGKSVTGQAILRIIPRHGRITAGSILFSRGDGAVVDVTAVSDRSPEIKAIRRRDISIIFQEPMTSLSPVHTVGDQIGEVYRLCEPGITREAVRGRTIEILGKVGIPKPELRVDAYTFELSGGMRQRAMIAMALASNPGLLIADEPTTAVDVTIQAQVLELLKQLQGEFQMSVLMITHNMGVVAAVANRVAVMYRGRVVKQGPVRAIFKEPHHPYTRGLIRSIPTLTGPRAEELWSIKGVVPPPYARVPGCSFHPRCEHFMVGVCDGAVPPPTAVSPEHEVACYLYGGRDGVGRPGQAAGSRAGTEPRSGHGLPGVTT